jgi:hypothetical protein
MKARSDFLERAQSIAEAVLSVAEAPFDHTLLEAQIARVVTHVLPAYQGIGALGLPSLMMVVHPALKRARGALRERDEPAMVRALEELVAIKLNRVMSPAEVQGRKDTAQTLDWLQAYGALHVIDTKGREIVLLDQSGRGKHMWSLKEAKRPALEVWRPSLWRRIWNRARVWWMRTRRRWL